ncbi:hypothetical protein Golob_026265 [Gossypium lobatum]|uniref:Uncharacterized protein n=1 Tax=Gossypium lobatum TaxID=34289 RepID=A0A7J8LUK4_9ROSI|nr:hypothetical protein [Gossypium lobatum]
MVLIPKEMDDKEGLIFWTSTLRVTSGMLLLIREHLTCLYRKRLQKSLACQLGNRIKRSRQ